MDPEVMDAGTWKAMDAKVIHTKVMDAYVIVAEGVYRCR
jgi:hypothetical protein